MINGTAKTSSGPVALWDKKNGTKIGRSMPANTQFEWITKDTTWLELVDHTWINCGSSFQYATVLTSPTTVTPPQPPPVTVKVTHILHIDDTGRVSTDGGPFV
jgi:hypothetical protein